jgi:hypothetical protein
MVIGLNANHRTICKYAAKTDVFNAVVLQMQTRLVEVQRATGALKRPLATAERSLQRTDEMPCASLGPSTMTGARQPKYETELEERFAALRNS